jgi:hydroxymethylpyrimidine pyrophosphatase-like HAD family hydrolase
MMFATDLDRTIVYSRKALKDLGPALNEQMLPVEKKDDKELSFMTVKAFELLREIARDVMLVPVTTRTTEQFQRIFIFNEQIPVKYAVTFNGAEILYEGNPLPDWRESINEKLKKDCAGHDELRDILKKDLYHVNGQLKSAEGLFIYYLLEEKLDSVRVNDFKRAAAAYGWRVSYQGRKLYFMPNPISKGEAVSFIKEREGIDTLIGAGDSLLDEDFLVKCDHSFIPAHGELAEKHGLLNYIETPQRGALAAEDILEKIKAITSKNLLGTVDRL